jgi:methyl-accepting chemotaxis protein
MAGLLDQVAYEEPIERIPTVPGGRDEVNAMAQSVNAMADHKAHFLDWWKSSMREAEAFEQASAQPDSVEAREELEQSQRVKQVLGRELQEKIRTLIRSVSEHAQRLEQSHLQGKRLEDTQDIEKASKSALAILDVMLGPEAEV